ncbi:MAG: HAMP domain-containing histidine kinase [Actinomycetota bacterium]|nr:HAMP domain-containing histidine kinase [Actinomycetota bacterium]
MSAVRDKHEFATVEFAGAYRGADRRSASPVADSPLGRPFVLACLLLITLTLLFGLALVAPPPTGAVRGSVLSELLHAFSAVLAVVVAIVCLLRWRLIGDAPALWMGAAMLVLGAVTIALGNLLPLVLAPSAERAVLGWVRPAGLLVVVAMLAQGIRSAPVDTRFRPVPVLLWAAGAVVVLAGVLQAVPLLAMLFAGLTSVLPKEPAADLGLLVMTCAWLVLAVVYTLNGMRHQRWLCAWFGLMLFGLTLGELVRVSAPPRQDAWAAAAEVFWVVALWFALIGATRELQRVFSDQSSRLLDSLVNAMATEARLQADRAALQERAHEARNALYALDGATRTLERHRDALDEGMREALSAAVQAEIARLQRLVDGGEKGARIPFHIAEAVGHVVTCARSQGASVLCNLPRELQAVGRPADVAEVVQNLLENARRYAPGSPVRVRADRSGDRVVVRIEDRGPGIPADQRDEIFERGRRGSTAGDTPGSGLGLFVSRQLLRDQDGELWVDDRPGGGASFALQLPAAEPDAAEGASPDGNGVGALATGWRA